MSRIPAAFARARSEGRAALITYLCAGDPSLDATAAAVPRLFAAGADVVELGVPFSDPVADGETIQRAAERALRAGTTLSRVLQLVARLREEGTDAPLVLMGYLNPILSLGIDDFCDRAAAAGVDGLIVPDLPVDEAGPLGSAAAARGIDLVLLAAPTTAALRLARIGAESRGFLYYVSVTGVTGARAALPDDLAQRLALARSLSRVPVAVGFGVSTPDQARALAAHADGVVVGSALVKTLHDAGGDPGPATVLVRSLARGLRGGDPPP